MPSVMADCPAAAMISSGSDSWEEGDDVSPSQEGTGGAAASSGSHGPEQTLAESTAKDKKDVFGLCPAELQDVWVPQRVTDVLKSSTSFAEFRKRRIFTFCHFFSGKEDVLAKAIRRLAELDGMTVKFYSFDRLGK